MPCGWHRAILVDPTVDNTSLTCMCRNASPPFPLGKTLDELTVGPFLFQGVLRGGIINSYLLIGRAQA